MILQSRREVMEAAKEKSFPYTSVCDPDQKMHQLFKVRPAAWKEELSGANAARKVKRAADLGLVHGKYEGNELQLPVSGNSRKKP